MADYITQLSEQGIFVTEMNLTAIVTGLLLTLILSYLLSLILAITIAGAMMIIGNNLAPAFGLLGPVSIIRFRLSLKTTTDMAFVLITIVIGMAASLGFVALAVIFTFVIGAVLLLMKWLKFGHRGRHVSRYEVDIDYDDGDIDREGEPDGITADSLQAIWLKKQLALSQAPWKIVYMHHSPYSSSVWQYGEGSNVNRFFPALGNHDWRSCEENG